jgi:hypothetical protein
LTELPLSFTTKPNRNSDRDRSLRTTRAALAHSHFVVAHKHSFSIANPTQNRDHHRQSDQESTDPYRIADRAFQSQTQTQPAMRFSIAVSVLIALAGNAVAQQPLSWSDAASPAAVSTTTQATTTITMTLELVHTETVYPSSNSTAAWSASSTAAPSSPVAAETTSRGAAPVASPTGVSGASALSRDMAMAVIAAGAVALFSC